VGNNFDVDRQVSDAFESAIEAVRGFGYPLKSVAVPLGNPWGGLGNIEAGRKGIAGQTIKEIEVLLLPTTTTTVPAIRDAGVNPQALSPPNSVFANYYNLPGISAPCGFDSNNLPLELQMVGKPWDEATVLHLAHRYETTTCWKTKHPDV